jgi:hypothetical protein
MKSMIVKRLKNDSRVIDVGLETGERLHNALGMLTDDYLTTLKQLRNNFTMIPEKLRNNLQTTKK